MVGLDEQPRPGVVAVADLKSIPTHGQQDQYRFTQDVRKLNKHRQFVKHSDLLVSGIRYVRVPHPGVRVPVPIYYGYTG